ncbi:hypothetical protein BD311DRAFT_275471 [Dichomitus squalens]|uniref:F-box domain-containing protein n=1 Tax=Dichomitus squalens TaxID=114155 RepID=A0A4Q9MP21_9APHY|nr:hypothetical protein BD311DRAFT_275471 [Dichomitus squalens]
MHHQHSDTLPFPDFASSVPEPDRASLARLSSDEIRAWTLRKSDEYRLLSYTMLSLHNAAAPIHTLPTELLVKIFGQTWKDWRSVHLTSVCRRWRSVYLSTPQFWAAAVSGLTFFYYDGTVMAGREDVRPVTAALLERSLPMPHQSKDHGTRASRRAPPTIFSSCRAVCSFVSDQFSTALRRQQAATRFAPAVGEEHASTRNTRHLWWRRGCAARAI